MVKTAFSATNLNKSCTRVVGIVQARMNSTRLPGKVLRHVAGMPLLEILLCRLISAEALDEIVVAVPTHKMNEPIAACAAKLGLRTVYGSETDVLSRYVKACLDTSADVIVRITGDCPFSDPAWIDFAVRKFLNGKCDYLSNINPATFPDGLDIEVFSREALLTAHNDATSNFDREHVTPFIRNSKLFLKKNFETKPDLSDLRLTVDEQIDLDLIEKIFEKCDKNIFFDYSTLVKIAEENNDLFLINAHIRRNSGHDIGTGQKLWARSKSLIPGGNMLLSKRAEMYLPEKWPAYFSKSKGCQVWDLDGNDYIDVSTMGVGTNILGYGNECVDAKIRDVIDSGVMSTLNCPEEVFLAEKLIETHPWADMVKLARTGAEANSIATRVSRAASGKDTIAVCGYHGWHDWYLAMNIADPANLDKHLLPGLEPRGVPDCLVNSAVPFYYNDIESLKDIVSKFDIGVVVMEPQRNEHPQNGFLSDVRNLCDDNGIVLVFDECTVGFRETIGGLHLKYGVIPDLAVFGKALGNGYAITAVAGKREIMQESQSSFVSSTFWTERIGPAAGLATINEMQTTRSFEFITSQGKKLQQFWKSIAKENGIQIEISGIPALSSFTFPKKKHLKYKTFVTQEMLKRGFLAGNSVYLSVAHDDNILDSYLENLNEVFRKLKKIDDDPEIVEFLDGPVCHSGFERLN